MKQADTAKCMYFFFSSKQNRGSLKLQKWSNHILLFQLKCEFQEHSSLIFFFFVSFSTLPSTIFCHISAGVSVPTTTKIVVYLTKHFGT